ncbi:hypothetical protein B0H17DRAFT_919616 [Mycena rosella]|uniref:Guanine nucleotide-binding protein-like 1 n=1 Tax=Mycena rosella TaxID=1033263 RepID=A0AAD7GV46_MYCRO|nr:hypothetical protein B0H17DRAFT_919616 [Mycena rosella]
MPPRKRPTSSTKKKAATQLKRAIKRGDVPAEPKKPVNRKHRGPPVSDAVQASRKLQSAFVTLPALFLEQTKVLAASLALTRPIPNHIRRFPSIELDVESTLTCPRRPKWRFDMTKIEVEHNEEGLFKKWLAQTDESVQKWQDEKGTRFRFPKVQPIIPPSQVTTMPRSTTYFERNLEVWRQLWRVTEISHIILVLLDSRAPLLHYPPSLATYLSDHRVILVLTKVDISGPARADAWTRYFNVHYPTLRVVQVESYIEKEASSVHQGRKQHEPHLPESFRHRLLDAIRQEHAAMLEPPERIKADPARLAKWKPPVKRDVDWERVMTAEGVKVGTVVGGPAVPREDEPSDEEPKFLTIGLIGQPNVGKSSLLNALFGAHKVRASKTPGKTKHFQTLFWTPDVRLVDCPGLVMPNFVPMEMQVLSGILPISRVSAIPSCIHHAAELLPLEKVYRIAHPTQTDALVAEDKRTWRNSERPGGSRAKETAWTAMDVLIGYADAKGWVTAKAGRSDIHRAGNAILRALAEGRISWAFWPPDTDTDAPLTSEEDSDGMGVWIPRTDDGAISEEESEEDGEEDDEDEGDKVADSHSPEESGEESGSEPDAAALQVGAGRFGALQEIEDDDEPESP